MNIRAVKSNPCSLIICHSFLRICPRVFVSTLLTIHSSLTPALSVQRLDQGIQHSSDFVGQSEAGINVLR